MLCTACERNQHEHCGAQVSESGIKCNCSICWGTKVQKALSKYRDYYKANVSLKKQYAELQEYLETLNQEEVNEYLRLLHTLEL